MKFELLTGAFLVLSSSAYAEANLFRCNDVDSKYTVSYTSTSFDGEPTMDVTVDGKSVTSLARSSSFIAHEETTLGSLLSLVVTRNDISDIPSRAYSFFLPKFGGSHVNEANFTSQLLVSSIGGRISAETPRQQIVQSVALDCSATTVNF